MMFSFNRTFSLGILLLLAFDLAACSKEQPDLPTPVIFTEQKPTITMGNLVTAERPSQTDQGTAEAWNTGSPDIKLGIVYEKEENLWLSLPGSLQQITAGGRDSRPRFSDDGKLVVFQRGDEFWALDVATRQERRIYGETGGKPLQFQFVPRSHNVFFTTANIDGKPRYDLNFAKLDQGKVIPLLAAGQGGEFSATPDWATLALVQPDKIIIYSIATGNAKVAFLYSPAKDFLIGHLPPVSWLENGYGFKTVIPGFGIKPARFLFIPANDGKPAQLAEFRAATITTSQLYISPDGSKVLYLKEEGENLEMHVIDASTADVIYLKKLRGKLGIMGWAPDSKKMIFWLDVPQHVWMSDGKTSEALGDDVSSPYLIWLNPTHCLLINGTDLNLLTLGQGIKIVDHDVEGSFDAIVLP